MPGQCLNEYWLIVQSESGNRTWKVVLISRFASVKSVWVCRLQMATVFVQASICWRRYLSYIQKSLKLWAYVLRLTATVKNMYINGNWCGTVVSQLLTHWSYSGLAQSLYCCCCWGDGGGGGGGGGGGLQEYLGCTGYFRQFHCISVGLWEVSGMAWQHYVRQQWRCVCLCWSITGRMYRRISNEVMEPRGLKWASLGCITL